MTRNDITGNRIASRLREAFDWVFGKSSQCGDCGGTRKVDGKPVRFARLLMMVRKKEL